MKNVPNLLPAGKVSAVVLAAVLISLAGSIPARAQSTVDAKRTALARDPLLGVWEVTVGIVDCSTGAPLGPPFQSHLTFTSDGTFSEVTNASSFAVGQRSEGSGVYRHAGVDANNNYLYDASSEAFIQFTSDPNPPSSPGFLVGTQTIDQTIDLTDRNHWTADAKVTFSNAGGDVYRQACAKATAERY